MTDITQNNPSQMRMGEIPVRIKADIYWLKVIGGAFFALGIAASSVLFSQIGSVREELRHEIGTVRGEISSVRGEIGSLREELQGEISSLREELQGEINSLREVVNDNRAALARIEALLSNLQ